MTLAFFLMISLRICLSLIFEFKNQKNGLKVSRTVPGRNICRLMRRSRHNVGGFIKRKNIEKMLNSRRYSENFSFSAYVIIQTRLFYPVCGLLRTLYSQSVLIIYLGLVTHWKYLNKLYLLSLTIFQIAQFLFNPLYAKYLEGNAR